MNTLKIKETFSNLPNKKIDSIQKVINDSNDKTKLRLNMTTKGLYHKQVIIPMSCDLSKRFIKDSSSHVININQALKSIKFNICTDFISADNKGIITLTDNVATNSDLQEIEKYVKSSLVTNDDSVTNFIQLVSPQPVGRFSQTKLCWKATNEGYPHMCEMYKSNNK